jgi:hypothetical protein
MTGLRIESYTRWLVAYDSYFLSSESTLLCNNRGHCAATHLGRWPTALGSYLPTAVKSPFFHMMHARFPQKREPLRYPFQLTARSARAATRRRAAT